jgi:neutral ceramidase
MMKIKTQEIKHLPAPGGSFSKHIQSAMLMLSGLVLCFLFNAIQVFAGISEPGITAVTAGVAKVNITPRVPVVMAGYGSRTEPFKGINDEIYAAATVFDDGVNRAAVITAEVLYFSHKCWEELTGRIEQETGIAREFIILAPVHTHGAPSTRMHGDNIDNDLLEYNIELRDKLVAVTVEAAGNLRPSLVGMGKGICRMSMNRRALNANGGIRLGKNPYGPCDQEVAVVRIDDHEGTPVSVFVNWPAHATVMGGGNHMITGDWPGAARRYIEREFPLPVIAAFTAGASGDIDPIYRVQPDFRWGEMEEIGIILGREVIRVAGEITSRPAGSISASQRLISLPGKVPSGSNHPEAEFKPGPDVDVRLTVLKGGNIVFAGISGEVFTEIGLRIKELSPYKNTIIITHCNGASGYLITDQSFSEGGYEVSVTRALPGGEKVIVDQLIEMITSLD